LAHGKKKWWATDESLLGVFLVGMASLMAFLFTLDGHNPAGIKPQTVALGIIIYVLAGLIISIMFCFVRGVAKFALPEDEGEFAIIVVLWPVALVNMLWIGWIKFVKSILRRSGE